MGGRQLFGEEARERGLAAQRQEATGNGSDFVTGGAPTAASRPFTISRIGFGSPLEMKYARPAQAAPGARCSNASKCACAALSM